MQSPTFDKVTFKNEFQYNKCLLRNKDHTTFSVKGSFFGLAMGFGKDGMRVMYGRGGMIGVKGDEGCWLIIEQLGTCRSRLRVGPHFDEFSVLHPLWFLG